MTAYTASLQSGTDANWQIAKATGLWAMPTATAQRIRRGDELFIWQAEAGWVARCTVLTDAAPVGPGTFVPWQDGRPYKWIFEIAVDAEIHPAHKPQVVDNVLVPSGIPTVYVRGGSALTAAQATSVRSIFDHAPPSNPNGTCGRRSRTPRRVGQRGRPRTQQAHRTSGHQQGGRTLRRSRISDERRSTA